MCVNFVVNNLVGTITLVTQLGVDSSHLIFSNNHKAGSRISIVTGAAGQRQLPAAIWWLYLQQTPQGLAPHKEYFSVNTNHAKLPQKHEYKVARCIVPASGFVESQDGKRTGVFSVDHHLARPSGAGTHPPQIHPAMVASKRLRPLARPGCYRHA